MMFWLPIWLVTAMVLTAQPVWSQGNEALVKQGQEIYENNCADCHRSNGEGLPVKFPALKGNALVTGAAAPLIATVLNGRKGPMGLMPAWKDHLNDGQVAALATYIRQTWSNQAPAVTPEMVAEVRKRGK